MRHPASAAPLPPPLCCSAHAAPLAWWLCVSYRLLDGGAEALACSPGLWLPSPASWLCGPGAHPCHFPGPILSSISFAT